jgi:hypothetical protein
MDQVYGSSIWIKNMDQDQVHGSSIWIKYMDQVYGSSIWIKNMDQVFTPQPSSFALSGGPGV